MIADERGVLNYNGIVECLGAFGDRGPDRKYVDRQLGVGDADGVVISCELSNCYR